jgi:hypothetical protein
MEYWFAGCDEGSERAKFSVYYALLVELPLNFVKDGGNNISRVLESDGRIPCVSCLGQKGYLGYGIFHGQIEPVLVVVRVCIVCIYSIAHHASFAVQPLQHDISPGQFIKGAP